MTKYTVVYTEETEGGFSGRCLELPGAISQGETLEEVNGHESRIVKPTSWDDIKDLDTLR
jgi:hypothetical protein